MDRPTLGLVSATSTAVSAVPYLVAMRRGTVRPQRMSWFVYAMLAVVAAVVQVRAESSAGSWLAAGSAVGFATIFVSSLRRGAGGWRRADRGTFVVAIAAAALLVLDRPLAALVAIVVAEVAATALTVHKLALEPHAETWTTWSVDAVAGAVAIAALTAWNVDSVLYPVHHVTVNLWVVLAIVRARARGPRSAIATAGLSRYRTRWRT